MSILNRDVFNEYNLNYDPVGLRNISLPDSFFTPAFTPEPDDIEAIIEARKNRDILNRQGLLSLDDAGIEEEAYEEFPETGTIRSGIQSLFNKVKGSRLAQAFLGGINPLLGGISGLIGNRPGIRGGIGLRGDSIFDTFGRSTTLADFAQRMRDKRAREEAARIGAAKQKAIIAGQQVDTGGGIGGETIGGTFGASVNDPGSFSDYS